MTPNDKLILTAFIQSLARFDRPELPADLQGQLNGLQDVANHALELKKLINTDPDLATLYRQERARLMAEASDRQKGFLPRVTGNPYNTEQGNLVEQLEQICHAPNSAETAKNLVKSQGTGGIFGFFKRIFSN